MRSTPNNYYRISDGRDPLRIGLLWIRATRFRLFLRGLSEISIPVISQKSNSWLQKKIVRETPRPVNHNRSLSRCRHRLSDARLRKRLLYDLYLRLDARMNPGKRPTRLSRLQKSARRK